MHFGTCLNKTTSLSSVLVIVSSLFVISSSITPNVFGEQNIDVGIWFLSNLDENYTKNECFIEAVNLAATISDSKIGQEAFSKVGKTGESLMETIDKINIHPELQVKTLVNNWAQYEGDMGMNENIIYLDEDRLMTQLDLCKDADKKDAIHLHIATILLHETAHWSDNVIKYPYSSGDTLGEEGVQFEKDVFGGVISLTTFEGLVVNESSLLKNGQILGNIEIQELSNPNYWI